MKRSRMFLGMTTGLLAVAGVVAVKASNFGNVKAYYITTGTNHFCVLATTLCNKVTTGAICPTANAIGSYYTLKTANGHCNTQRPLQYTQE